ncbi:MAG: hypothetical protein L0G99_01015 [Propionibacteriales bacterium]|nr:hypothetical protein [Propionibacteriales bacterium]
MSEISWETQKLQAFGEEITQGGAAYRRQMLPMLERARLNGHEWPLLTMGVQAAYTQAHSDMGDAFAALDTALTSLGAKITDVARFYAEYEENA